MRSLICLGLLFGIAACTVEPECSDSLLTDQGIEGRWEIYQRTDTMTMTPAFVQDEFLTINEDSLCNDLIGSWEYRSGADENSGGLALDTLEGEITFFSANLSFRRDYTVVDYDNLVLRYDEGGLEIRELWRRQ